jgi:glycosyltransferase involved in cell wall biosynthesis
MTTPVVFVAGEVGGPGGMEHQSEQLILRLLDAGIHVTVIARSCELPRHERLKFVRVRTPTRPFAVAYPAFIAVASVLAARRREAILHTTGATVVNRADVSTVHYCHRAARNQLGGSRAARDTAAHRLNAALAAVMSRAAEAWCYRPERARLLCAVSNGTSAELEREFPRMRDAIVTVPNGVDTGRFRPDPEARRRARAELGISETQLVAVFAGGDWDRKGLPIAIAALEHAPEWLLAVAGVGDGERMRALADAAGAGDRLQLLGRVREMPALYAAADAFVFPTSYEAFPLVALEAAASGLPLLTTRVNGATDLVEDGVNGWFIARDPRDIARRLSQLAADPILARTMATAATDSVRPYTWDAMGERYLALYADIASRANGTA